MVVFIGQLGGSSVYLQKYMTKSFPEHLQFRYSSTGKLDVVKGALFERLLLRESFLRLSKTVRNYGTLVSLPYSPRIQRIFPDPRKSGAVGFRHEDGEQRITTIQWSVPRVSNESSFYDSILSVAKFRERLCMAALITPLGLKVAYIMTGQFGARIWLRISNLKTLS
jgi:hypothetical protein